VALAPKTGIALALLQALSVAGQAAQLPVRTYTTADGLPRNTIYCIVSDRRGFLWLCTPEGLARFDGYQFQTYGVNQGLPSPVVNAFVETPSGLLVAGTDAGLAVLKARVDDRARDRFEVYYPGPTRSDRMINALFVDRSGVLWTGTSMGLCRIRWTGSTPHFEMVAPDKGIVSLAQDQAGNLWAADFHKGIVELTSAGEVRRYGEREGVPRDMEVSSVAVDGEGSIWAGTHGGLCKLRRNSAADGSIVERIFTSEIGPIPRILSLYVSRSGRLWAGSPGRASQCTGDSKQPFRHWGVAEKLLVRAGVHAFGEDGAGNLWMGTYDEGAKRVAPDGFRTYTEMEGLARQEVNAFGQGRDGELFAVTLTLDSLDLNLFDGERFHAVHPALPRSIRWFGWGWGSIALQDREGDWWLATGQGLCRFDGRGGVAALARALPKAVYTTKDGLAGNDIFRLFEDSRGDIWVATTNPSSVSRWDRASASFQRPPIIVDNGQGFTAFAEDRGGNVWIGSSVSVWRWRESRLEKMDRPEATPASASALFVDPAGSLWVASREGLFRCDDPVSERPGFHKVLSDATRCVTQDRWGRIYACTGRGVICLNPATGRLRRFTTADGLAPGLLQCAYADRRGDIWFGLLMGASRFTPQPDTPHPGAPVYITSIRSSGHDVPVAEGGEISAADISLRPYDNSIEVGFVGIELGAGRSLDYEYKLEGAHRDWQAMDRERSIRLAGLAPGTYRLLVRAINTEGAVSDPPASVTVFVSTPVWRRWWALALMSTTLAALLYIAHQQRMRRVLELERVRTRIATDLHDDVGASLSQVAIMSEVVSRRAVADREALKEIAGTSRELLQSMSEIVWAIDPSHDRLHDLIQHMRWFAGETLSGREISLHFSVGGEEDELRLKVDTRRQVFLIFKESVNNIVRHAQARSAKVALKAEQNSLVLEVADDGCGFDAGQGSGHGLRNMAERARALGGDLEVRSCRGDGTRLVLRVPLGGSPLWRRWLAFPHKHAGTPVREDP
jgi:signal transduction histidine kinase/ligand-binding sensor domain-containing protein